MPVDRPLASLPMYDWPEVRWATDALWSAIAERLGDQGITAPTDLDRTRRSDDIWTDPGLVLSQTCGWPYATRLVDRVGYVATPVYEIPGCDGPFYSSMIVARRDRIGEGLPELAARRVAFNAPDSLSGFVALRAAMREAGVAPSAAEWLETGSHRASVIAVARGEADLAAIDCVCWALALEHESAAAGMLEVVAQTPRRPGLPLVRSKGLEGSADIIFDAVGGAIASVQAGPAGEALHLRGAVRLSARDYKDIYSALRDAGAQPDPSRASCG